MGSRIHIRDVSVDLASPIEGGLVISNVSVSNHVGAPPTVTVVGHLQEFANRKGAELDLGRQSEVIAAAQEGFFEPRERPESSITVRVGRESVTIQCYLSKVSYVQGIAGRGVGVHLTFIHPSIVLKSVDLSIYSAYQIHTLGASAVDSQAERDRYNRSLVDITGSLTDRMAEMVARFTTSPRWPDMPPAVRAVKQRVHEVNQTFTNYLQNCLTASDELDGWDMGELDRRFSTGLNRWLIESQIMRPGNFFDVLRQSITQELLLMFVAKLDDPLPRIVSLSQTSATNPLEVSLPVRNFAPSTGSSIMTPTTNTFMMGNAQYYSPHVGPQDQGLQPLRVYPEENRPGGQFHSVHAPAWLRYTASRGEGPLPYRSPPTGAFDLDALREKTTNFMTRVVGEFTDERINRIFERWTKIHHYHQLYGHSDSEFETEVRFNMQPGLCYRVSSLDEENLFTGFLASAQHTIHIGETGGKASTKLRFSHVRAGVDMAGAEEGPLNARADAETGLPSSGFSF